MKKRTDLVEVRKVIARTAFDAALGRELHEVIQEAKKTASQTPAVVRSVGLETSPDPTA